MKKKAAAKVFKKTVKFKNKGLKKEGEEKKPWFNEDEDWKKDGLEEPEEKKPLVKEAASNSDGEDGWIEKDNEPDEEDAKIIEEDFPEEDDKDNY